MKFKNIKMENKEYTLVDMYEEFGDKKIYHFVGDEDEIFCTKNNEKYEAIIDEEKIKEIKEKLYFEVEGIYFSDIERFSRSYKKNNEHSKKITKRRKRGFSKRNSRKIKRNRNRI